MARTTQQIDTEKAVLGAILFDKDALALVGDLLTAESFTEERHRIIWNAIIELDKEGGSADFITVVKQISKHGQIGKVEPHYITTLTERMYNAANIEAHARILMQNQIRREIAKAALLLKERADDFTTDPLELLADAQERLDNIATRTFMKRAETSYQVHKRVLESYSTTEAPGVRSGLTELDKMLSGFKPSDLIILAARPGMGKTSLALTIATNAALRYGVPACFFSLEMSKEQLAMKQQSIHTGIPLWKIINKKLNPYELGDLNTRIGPLLEANIVFDDAAAPTINELRAKCKQYKNKFGLGLIIIDYLQLIDGGHSGNREQEISTISRTLKRIAKDLNIPVIALSQLSRAVEQRGGDKKPQLSDLRESGAIEQDADVVMFAYRPEYYQFTEDAEGNSLAGMASVIIAKHRNGALGEPVMRFDSNTTGFFDLEPTTPY